MAVESEKKATPNASSPAADPAAGAAAKGPRAVLRYIDRPDCEETFADTISRLSFDGQTLRIEFAVTRYDDSKPGADIAGRIYPTCRLVLTPTAAGDLMSKMQQIANTLMQARTAKQAAAPQTPSTNPVDSSAGTGTVQ
jgi:hypothetical protein